MLVNLGGVYVYTYSYSIYLYDSYLSVCCIVCGASGDHAVKAVGVIPEPEVKIFDLQEGDQFMIMASDGVWEFISSQVQ